MGIDQCRRRWRWRCYVIVLIGIFGVVNASDSNKKREKLVSRIAFGSCSNQNAPQPIWDAIVDFHPQIFIWLGDNIYGDIKRPFKLFGRERTIGPWKNVPRFVPSSEQEMEASYKKAKSNPVYVQLQENAEVIGTWDDHDYGLNDAGKEFHGKITNQKLLLDFLDEPQDSPRWEVFQNYGACDSIGCGTSVFFKESEDTFTSLSDTCGRPSALRLPPCGVWGGIDVRSLTPASREAVSGFEPVTFWSQGSNLTDCAKRKQAGVYASYTFGPVGRDVKIVLLDTRYHRDSIGSDGTILGDSQWLWLERELKGPPTAITIIGSSIQVISNLSATIHPLFAMESWGRFPKERDRLFKLIADSKRDGVFFISGDVHFGEITRYDCAVDYPLYDVTSSGITQSIEEVVPHFFRSLVRFVAWLTPSTMRVKDPNCRYKSCIYGQPNFGTIEIDWDSHPVTLELKVRDKNGVAVTGVNISLMANSKTGDRVKAGHNQRHCTLEASLPWIIRYRLAILFLFTLAVLLLAFLGLVCYTSISVCRLGGCKRKHD